MKFSEAWLREWVNPDLDRAALLEQLSMAGLEVEGAEPVAGRMSGVVVARVEAVQPHPAADSLSVCQVSDGTERFSVVCGAPNVRSGMLAAFARPGAVLPGEVRISTASLRGVQSQGMLCSAAELGMGEEEDRILELDEGCPEGVDLAAALSLEDVIIDLDVTPNRGDCLSVRGLARELGVLNGSPAKPLQARPAPVTSQAAFPVAVEDAAGCPHYLGRVIEGIDPNARTPFWVRERLRRCGLRSVGPAVDLTNYVMLELGQPMHAFDLDRLSDGIQVRRARPGERLRLLDGRDAALDEETLLIADGDGPVAVAGLMGGERSGVAPSTRNLFLECAFFSPRTVSRAARRLGLHTDASHRYERGVDFELSAQAMERATELLLEVAGGAAGPVQEWVSSVQLPKPRQVRLRQRRLDELAGVAIGAEEVDRLLARLDFPLAGREETEADGVVWTLVAPSHRFDIAIEADLVEEVCRIYGYQRLPERLPSAPLSMRPARLERSDPNRLKARLADQGFQEIITYSFVDPALQDLLDPQTTPLPLANPMSREQSVMRTNLLPGLVDALRFNLNRRQERAQLFELGLCFRPGPKLEQVLMLGGLLWGARVPESWHGKRQAADFFDLKGQLELLLEWAGIPDLAFETVDDPVLHPGQRAAVLAGDRVLGRIGRLHPELEQRLDLASGVFVFELLGDAALERPLRTFAEIPKVPGVRRDLALLVDEEVTARQVRATLAKALGSALAEFRLFDLYRGEGIDSRQKSMAVGLTLQHPSATLTEDEVTRWLGKAVAALEAELGARLR